MDPEPARRPRHPWYRFTIRRAMVAVPAAALAVVLAAGIDPFRRDPLRRAEAEAVAWCGVPTAPFQASVRVDWTSRPPTTLPDRPAIVAGPCLLKIERVGHVVSGRQVFLTYGARFWLGPDGRSELTRVTPLAIQGGTATTSPAEVAAVRRILPTLPASQVGIPVGAIDGGMFLPANEPQMRLESRAIVLGFHDGRSWVTRTYDRWALPPAVAELLSVAGCTASGP